MKETNKILILCAYYTESNNANGVCAKNIAEEFVKRGKKVWVISSCDELNGQEQNINGVRVRFIEVEHFVHVLKNFRQHKGLINRLKYLSYRTFRNFSLLLNYPNNSPTRSKKVYALAEQLIAEHDIDTVLGTYRPFESIYSSIKLKKKYGNRLKVCTYHLDLLTLNDEWKGIASRIMHRKAKTAVKKECEIVDKVLIPENYFDRSDYVFEKMEPIGFPLYIQKKEYERSNIFFDDDELSIVYIGSLDKNNRNPKDAVRIVESLSKDLQKKVILHIWGKLWDAETKDILNSSECVVYHGYIDNKYVQDVLMKCDALLNISNKVIYNFLPSKIFQYFAMEKPIINIVQHKDDCSCKYFEYYGKAFNYCIFQPYTEQENNLKVFAKELNNTTIKAINKDKFERFTPSYICDKIESAHV